MAIWDIEPTQINGSLKGKYIMLYGAPKVGKTTMANDFPRSLICAFEPGTNALHKARVKPIRKWEDFKRVIRELADQRSKDQFDTVVIDTSDVAWLMCDKFVREQNPIKVSGIPQVPKHIGDIPYGKGWGERDREYEECFRDIASLGYGLVIISHEQQKEQEFLQDGVVRTHLQSMPTLPDRPRLIVNKLVDIILYIKNVQVDGEDKRILLTRGTPDFQAGSRFAFLSPVVEATFQSLEEAVKVAVEEEVAEKGGEAIYDDSSPLKEKDEDAPFEEVQQQAQEVWNAVVMDENISDDERESRFTALMNIISKSVGESVPIKDIPPIQKGLLEMALIEMQEFQNSLEN